VAFGLPEAPEVGLTFGLIALAFAYGLLFAINKGWEWTIGALLETLATMFDDIRTPHLPVVGSFSLGFVGDEIRKIDGYVLQAIGYGLAKTEYGMQELLRWMVWVFQATADEVAGLAHDTLRGFRHVRGYLIPTLLGAALAPILRELSHLGKRVTVNEIHPVRVVRTTVRVIQPGFDALEGRVKELESEVAHIGARAIPTATHTATTVIERVPATIPQAIYRGIDSLWKAVHELQAGVRVAAPAIAAGIGSIAVPKPAAIPEAISRGIDAIRKRVGQMGKTLTAAGIVGLVVAALARIGITWTRCRNNEKYGKAICGMNTDLLDSLIADTTLILGTVDLIEFCEELGPLTGYVTQQAARFWRVK